MLITESRLRRLVREMLLAEAVTNKHGYTVQSLGDVTWSPDKSQIPKDRNPFVGSSSAFESWFNDGEMVKMFFIKLNRGTEDETRMRRFQDVFVKEGDLVIIPDLWSIRPAVGEVIAVNNIPAANAGIPGSSKTDTIPLASIRFPFDKGIPTMQDVGLAFLRRLGSSRSNDAFTAKEAARDYMRARGAAGAADDTDADVAANEPVAARGVIRRRAGEAPAPRPAAPKGPATLTAADREMLLGRKRE